MRKTIPVIRAAAIIPLLRLLITRRHPVEDMLRASGIGYVWIEDPTAPIPIRAMETIALLACRLEGPDVGCQSVTDRTLFDLAALGRIALQSPTPRQAIARIAQMLPYHCSHETIYLTPGTAETVIHEHWALPLDPEAQHIVQQTVAAMVQLVLRMAQPDGPTFRSISLVPHPSFGLGHLKPFLSGGIVAASRPVLDMTVPNGLLDARFRYLPNAPLPEDGTPQFAWQSLQEGSLSDSASVLVRAMLRDGAPTIERLSAASGMSVRTLQRRFGAEGKTFSGLVEDVRRKAAMDAIAHSGTLIGDVAADLGYSEQSSLTRAVRRWTGSPPTALRGHRPSAAE